MIQKTGKRLKTDFTQIFSPCPKKSELPKIWGGCSPHRPPPGPYAYDRNPTKPAGLIRITTCDSLD